MRPNLDRLSEIKAKYDPSNLFPGTLNIEPKQAEMDQKKVTPDHFIASLTVIKMITFLLSIYYIFFAISRKIVRILIQSSKSGFPS